MRRIKMDRIELPIERKLNDKQLKEINKRICNGEMKVYAQIEGKNEVKEVLLQNDKIKRIYAFRKKILEEKNLLKNASKPDRINLLLAIDFYSKKIDELKNYHSFSVTESDSTQEVINNFKRISKLIYKNE